MASLRHHRAAHEIALPSGAANGHSRCGLGIHLAGQIDLDSSHVPKTTVQRKYSAKRHDNHSYTKC
jgi:hypothetical protein